MTEEKYGAYLWILTECDRVIQQDNATKQWQPIDHFY